MSVLFALSILAFVALLWATISIAGFVRRQRRRRRRPAANADPAIPAGIGPSSSEPVAVLYRDADATELANAPSVPATSSLPLQVDASITVAGASATVPPAPKAGPPPPPRLRSFPTRLGKQPAVTGNDTLPAWNPFSKDFGDLSDPIASRHLPVSRSRSKDTH